MSLEGAAVLNLLTDIKHAQRRSRELGFIPDLTEGCSLGDSVSVALRGCSEEVGERPGSVWSGPGGVCSQAHISVEGMERFKNPGSLKFFLKYI